MPRNRLTIGRMLDWFAGFLMPAPVARPRMLSRGSCFILAYFPPKDCEAAMLHVEGETDAAVAHALLTRDDWRRVL